MNETPNEGGSETGAKEFGFGAVGNGEPPLSFKTENISVYFILLLSLLIFGNLYTSLPLSFYLPPLS